MRVKLPQVGEHIVVRQRSWEYHKKVTLQEGIVEDINAHHITVRTKHYNINIALADVWCGHTKIEF